MFASMNDKELCAASSRGQSDAFVELVRRYEGAVCAVAYAVTQRRDLSEDVAQETFIVAWKKLPGIEAPDRVGAWLTGIARNIARRSWPSDRVEPLREADDHVAEEPCVEDVMQEHEERELVHRLLSGLPLRYREALVLYYRDEQSAARVGALLGISTSAAEQRISRGRRMLQTKVERAIERELVRTRPDAGFRKRVAAVLPALTPLGGAANGGSLTTALGKLIAMKKLLVAATALVVLATAYAVRSRATEVSAPQIADAATARSGSPGAPARRAAEASPTRLEGTVSAKGGPLLGAVVTVLEGSGAPASFASGERATVRVALDGQWSVEGLLPGTYAVAATAHGFLPAVSERIELLAEQTLSGVDVELAQGGQTVTGTVHDAGGGPVEGAFVRAVRPGMPPYSTMSAEDGSYTLTLPSGAYELEAREPDYQSQTRRLTLRDSERILDFQLIPGAAIFGTVVDRTTGDPVPGAVISFGRKFRSGGGFASNRSTDDERVTTDAQGRFSLRQLRAAEYQLFATADHAASRAPTTVAIGVAEQENDVLLLVDPAFNVSGRVVDQNDPSSGIANVDIEAFGVGAQVSVETKTDGNGNFVLRGLNPGSYPLNVRGADVVFSDVTIEVTHADLEGTVVTAERGTTLRGRLSPPTAGSIALKVPAGAMGLRRFEFARKVSGARTQAGGDGTFELSAPVGQWTLVATSSDGSLAELELDIPEGGLEDDLRVEMTPRPFIAGHLVDPEGAPVVGATLTVVPYVEGASPAELFFMSRSPVKATSDASGAFTLVGLKPASYRLTVEDRTGGALQGRDDAAFPLFVVEGDSLDEETVVVVPSVGTISGVVRDASGAPFGEAWVEVIAQGETTPNELQTPSLADRSGNFSFEGLRPGLYDIYAASTRGDATASLEGVELGPHDITLEPLGTVVGTVTVDGKPVESFSVQTGDVYHRAFSSPDGRFELARLPTGPRRVVVTADAGAGSTTVEIDGDQDIEIEVELSPWGRIEGRALDESGRPLAGAEVNVRAEGGRRPGLPSVFETDADGRFALEGVGAGSVQVDVFMTRKDGPELRGSLDGTSVSDDAVDLGDATLRAPQTPQ